MHTRVRLSLNKAKPSRIWFNQKRYISLHMLTYFIFAFCIRINLALFASITLLRMISSHIKFTLRAPAEELVQWSMLHSMYYGVAPDLLCQCNCFLSIYIWTPDSSHSVRSHDLAVEVSYSNLVTHMRSFVPSSSAPNLKCTTRIYSGVVKQARFKKKISSYLGAKPSALP